MEEKQYGALLKDPNLYCIIESKKVKYCTYENSNEQKGNGYLFNLVNSGPYKLLKKKTKILQKGKYAATSLTASIAPKFNNQTSYYIQSDNAPLKRITGLEKKELLSLFKKEDVVNIQSFIRKKNLRMDNENDLVTLFYYVNTIYVD